MLFTVKEMNNKKLDLKHVEWMKKFQNFPVLYHFKGWIYSLKLLKYWRHKLVQHIIQLKN